MGNPNVTDPTALTTTTSATATRRIATDFTRAVLAWLWLLIRDWFAKRGLVLPEPQPDRWLLPAGA